jgi:hypothetical protein
MTLFASYMTLLTSNLTLLTSNLTLYHVIFDPKDVIFDVAYVKNDVPFPKNDVLAYLQKKNPFWNLTSKRDSKVTLINLIRWVQLVFDYNFSSVRVIPLLGEIVLRTRKIRNGSRYTSLRVRSVSRSLFRFTTQKHSN